MGSITIQGLSSLMVGASFADERKMFGGVLHRVGWFRWPQRTGHGFNAVAGGSVLTLEDLLPVPTHVLRGGA
jgi:hypothetical protein